MDPSKQTGTVPCADQNLIQEEIQQKERSFTINAKARILYAEDDPIARLVIKKLLEKDGHCVSFAFNGMDALHKLEIYDFDLILMDIQMPEMDGIEATRVIRSAKRFSNKRDIPIIALTACATNGDRELFLSAGMNDFLPKPMDISALKDMIARTIYEFNCITQSV